MIFMFSKWIRFEFF